MKRVALAFLTLALAATFHPVTSAAEPVRARTGVTIEVTPTRIALSHAYEWAPWRISGADLQTFGSECRLRLRHRESGRLYFDGVAIEGRLSGAFMPASRGMPLGAFQPVAKCTRPGTSVVDTYAAANDVVVKAGSRAGVRSVSRGSRGTTVKGTVKVWNRGRLVFSGWENARVAVQVKKPAGWTTARIVTSGPGGAVKATFSTTGKWSWRLVTLGNSVVWPSSLSSPGIPLSTTLRVDASPERIAINQTFAPVTWSASRTDGEPLGSCIVWLENKRSRTGLADDPDLRENQSSGLMRIHHANVEPGPHTVVKECFFSGVAIDEVMVKWASRSGVRSVTRISGRTTVKAVVKRWDTYGARFIGWTNARVAIQVKKPSGWVTARIVRSGAGGAVSATFSTSTNLPWRVVALESARVWSSTSAAAQG